MTGANALLESLERQGVKEVFGILGGAILPVYDALCNHPKIRHILASHEQGAAHAADGYARASGRPGVCFATSGPGATNLVTGIANAYMDSSPSHRLNGTSPQHRRQLDLHDRQRRLPRSRHHRHNHAHHQIQLPTAHRSRDTRTVNTAFYIATTGRPGPVLIDFPKDIQAEIANVDFTDKIDIRGYKPPENPHPLQIRKAAELLAEAERPVILAGGGVISSNASRRTTNRRRTAHWRQSPQPSWAKAHSPKSTP